MKPPELRGESIVHDAQLEILNWVVGRCEDQFVRAWLVQERQLLKSIGYAVNQRGGGLDLSELNRLLVLDDQPEDIDMPLDGYRAKVTVAGEGGTYSSASSPVDKSLLEYTLDRLSHAVIKDVEAISK